MAAEAGRERYSYGLGKDRFDWMPVSQDMNALFERAESFFKRQMPLQSYELDEMVRPLQRVGWEIEEQLWQWRLLSRKWSDSHKTIMGLKFYEPEPGDVMEQSTSGEEHAESEPEVDDYY